MPSASKPRPSRDVVVTGLGAVTSLGVGAQALWDGLVAGRSGLGPISRFDASGFDSRLGGEVRDFSAKDFVPKNYRKAVKVMARDIELAVAAARCAVQDANLVTRGMLADGGDGPTTYPNERMGCQIGAGLIAAETDELTSALATAQRQPVPAGHRAAGFEIRDWGTESAPDGQRGAGAVNNLQPLWLLKYLPNMLACHVTIIHGAEGPSNTITCNEASGLLSLGESVRVIQRDAADLCFSGSGESKLNFMGWLRLTMARRLATTGDATDGASFVRPYDPAAQGGLLGEGAGILILEEATRAKARGAKVYAKVLGFGAGQTQKVDWARAPEIGENEGLRVAIENALEDAGIGPDDIDAIVPHGTGSPKMDNAELAALRSVFGVRTAKIPLVTVMPNLGEMMAGDGGVLACVGAMCVSNQQLPARLHAGTPAPDALAGPAPARSAVLRRVLVCTSSLGGQNAAVVFGAA